MHYFLRSEEFPCNTQHLAKKRKKEIPKQVEFQNNERLNVQDENQTPEALSVLLSSQHLHQNWRLVRKERHIQFEESEEQESY
ncbi:hypothetical protein CEXT_765071 [Caerostris extrusa]|uniref:Uncharacterized protein n=1 Tax=Caerostris extrusa TaxID=172846 RepID=A0AAV4SKG2_CAEEX|nr:hypothetical protein CEXT_765071 [Caerostris extrusa]